MFMPIQGKTDFIALGAGTPHCRPLGLVQHPELQGRLVGNYSAESAERVDLPDNLPLGYSAYRRIAGHLGKREFVHCQQEDGRT